MLNDWLIRVGVDHVRPLLAAFAQPPAPFIVMVLLGAVWLARQRKPAHGVAGGALNSRWPAWGLLLLGCAALWLSSTTALSQVLRLNLLPQYPALSPQQVAELKGRANTAIVVLGAGRVLDAPEYHGTDLKPMGNDRLRYGAWLVRQTGLPMMYTGGIGHYAPPGATEAEIATLVLQRDFQLTPRWLEGRSRDTRENGQFAVQMLQADGVRHIVLVTHGYHMARSVRNFQRAIAQQGTNMQLTPAPMGLVPYDSPEFGDFLPNRQGINETMLLLHEGMGWLIGA